MIIMSPNSDITLQFTEKFPPNLEMKRRSFDLADITPIRASQVVLVIKYLPPDAGDERDMG